MSTFCRFQALPFRVMTIGINEHKIANFHPISRRTDQPKRCMKGPFTLLLLFALFQQRASNSSAHTTACTRLCSLMVLRGGEGGKDWEHSRSEVTRGKGVESIGKYVPGPVEFHVPPVREQKNTHAAPQSAAGCAAENDGDYKVFDTKEEATAFAKKMLADRRIASSAVPAPSPIQQFEHLRRAVGGRSNNARSSIANPSMPKSGGGGYTRGARGRQGTLSTMDTIRARLEALPCQDDSASVTLQDEDSLEQRLEEENSNTLQGRSKHLGARKGPQCTCFTGTKVQILTGRVPQAKLQKVDREEDWEH
jgi:hypothetical protein